jgi:predicted helicase
VRERFFEFPAMLFTTPSRLTKLKPIVADSKEIVRRFYRSCIGWIRYKPLLLYITDRDRYSETIEEMKASLKRTLPAISAHFGTESFFNISKELSKYHRLIEKHYDQFARVKRIWSKICSYLREID